MRFSLADLASRAGQRRKVIPLAIITPTAALENDLAAIYMEVVRAWATIARDNILPAYAAGLARAGQVHDDVSGVEVEAASADAQISRLLLSLTPKLRRWVVQVEQWHRARWVSSVQPTGVDLSTMIGADDAKVTLDAVLQANVALVRNVSDEAAGRISGSIFRGFTARTPTRAIAKEISEGLGMSRARALRIASHQTSSLSAALTSERRRQAGLDTWEWVHSKKLHPRQTHIDRNGKEYTDATAPDDLPGRLPGCGCKEKPLLKL